MKDELFKYDYIVKEETFIIHPTLQSKDANELCSKYERVH